MQMKTPFKQLTFDVSQTTNLLGYYFTFEDANLLFQMKSVVHENDGYDD